MTEFEKVLQKQRTKEPITLRELAVVVTNDEETLAHFLVDNDPAQVNGLIHRSPNDTVIGRKGVGFFPNPKRILAELKTLMVKKDTRTLNYILENFKVNTKAGNWTSNPELLSKLRDTGLLAVSGDHYVINAHY